ncbi:MAG: hypothetical protein GEV06_16810 [Luteitalea sp.]|nr:hypothetical protein [Luteitalea sp.]
MTFKIVETTVSSAVVTAGTFTVAYPENTSSGTFAGGNKHAAWVDTHQYLYTAAAGEISLSFGASEITVTYNGSTTIAAGSRINAQLDILGSDDQAPGAFELPIATVPLDVYLIDLGAPVTADPNGVAESQTVTGVGTAFDLDGILVSGGEAIMDAPRALVGAWTNTAVITITGEDVYGNVMVEVSASGTGHTGTKAFKKVTEVTTSATITGASVGTLDVLGLPAYIGSAAYVLAELEDGAAAVAGTLVLGVNTTPTGTTGDVRGTYDPNTGADGSTSFKLLVVLPDPANRGIDQFAG